MITFLMAAALAPASPLPVVVPLCAGQGPCRPPSQVADVPAEIEARKSQFMALEAQVYAPLRVGRNEASCADARQRATKAQHQDIVAIINKLCQK